MTTRGAVGKWTNFSVDLNAPNLWRDRLKVAEEYRKQRAHDLDWDDCEDAVQGKILEDEPLQDCVVVQFPWAYIQQMLPTVYFRRPEIMVQPTREEYTVAARLMQASLNYELKRMRAGRQIKRAIRNALVYDIGILKLGWATQWGEIPPSPDEAKKKASSKTPMPHVRRFSLKPERPFLFSINPRMFLMDPYASCWEESRWFAQEYYTRFAYAIQDPFLDNKGEITPGWSIQETRYRRIAYQVREPSDEHCVRWYEIWDLDSGKVRLLAEGSKHWQRVTDHPYREIMDGVPFYKIQPDESEDDNYGTAPISMFLPQVREISKIRTKQLDHIYRMPQKVLSQRQNFNDEELLQMRDPDEHFCTCADPERVKEFSGFRPDPNMYIVEERAKKDIEHVSGFSELSLGAVPGGRTTATVGMIASRASAVRVKLVIDAVKDLHIDVAHDLAKLIQAFTSKKYQIAIQGDEGLEWIAASRAELQGEFLFDLDVTEMAPISRELQRKESIDLYVATANDPLVNRRMTLRDLFRGHGKTEPESYLHPDLGNPADPMFENLQLLRGKEVLPNPGEDVQLHLQVHADFLEDPSVQRIIAAVPAIQNRFSSHIQLTMQMARQLGVVQGAAAASGRGAGPTVPVGPEAGPGGGMSTMQRGQPLNTAQPAGIGTEGGV